jgi:hypothetical protein
MNTLGGTTTTIFFKGFSGKNLFEEFKAAAAIKAGQFVKITTDGEVTPISAGDNALLIVGVAFADAAEDAQVTVAMRGYGTLIAEGSAGMTPGPVKFASFTAGTGLNRFAQATETSAGWMAATSGGAVTTAIPTAMDKAMIGWSLLGAAANGDQIRVVVRN